jgi:NAD(P)-dependent dehydrogenase (short-subunit alcohol dehydrogenase family)
VLINNAAESRPGELNEDSIWEYEYKNILLSAMRTSAEFIAMPSSHLRKIVNITSIYGNLATGDPDYLQYSAFKAALANATATLSKSAAPQILVNAVAPGYTETPAWAGASSESKEACARATLIGRFVRPEEVAHAVTFVAENDALVGQVLTLDRRNVAQRTRVRGLRSIPNDAHRRAASVWMMPAIIQTADTGGTWMD